MAQVIEGNIVPTQTHLGFVHAKEQADGKLSQALLISAVHPQQV